MRKRTVPARDRSRIRAQPQVPSDVPAVSARAVKGEGLDEGLEARLVLGGEAHPYAVAAAASRAAVSPFR